MNTVRILVVGNVFTPIHELGERIANYHCLDFLTLESKENNRYIDSIPTNYIDTGDYTAGSGSSHDYRNPMTYKEMRELDAIGIDPPDDPLSPEEQADLLDCDFAVVSSEVPDPFLAEWADAIVFLNINEKDAIDWLSKRRKCPCCGAVYHLTDRPQQRQGYCDRCGSHTFQQEKDMPENIKLQFRVWSSNFWKLEKIMRNTGEGKYIKININDFDSFERISTEIDRHLRKMLNKPHQINWNESLLNNS